VPSLGIIQEVRSGACDLRCICGRKELTEGAVDKIGLLELTVSFNDIMLLLLVMGMFDFSHQVLVRF